ncbi:MAG TPA: hypothetical protein PK812_01230 [Beijerinckiaceae bacterium]|nr:hypothetical protein [Beijerinckiaceae bacterium]
MNFRSAGSVLLVAVVFVLVSGSMVADRLGAPSELVAKLTLMLAVGGLTAAGFAARSMKPSAFFAVGRNLSATAVLALMVTTMMSLGAVRATATGVLDLAMVSAACAGVLLFSATAAGPLRRLGGYTFADAIAARFGSRLLTAIAGILSFCMLGGLAVWLAPATLRGVQMAGNLKPEWASLTVLTLCASVIVPGGLAGVAAAALLSSALIVGAWASPILPAMFADSSTRTHWLEHAGTAFTSGSAAGADWPLLALAAAGLFTVLNLSGTVRSQKASTQVGCFAVMAVIAISFAGVFAHEVERQRVAMIESASVQTMPPIVFTDRFRGLVRICGSEPTTPDDLKRICARAGHSEGLPRSAVQIDKRGGHWYATILAIPSAAGEAFALAAPLALLVGLALACHAAAASLTHDLLRRFVLPPATAGGDLAVQRMAALLVLAAALYGPGYVPTVDPRLVSLLLFAAACCPLPLVVLARWRRADWRAALCGLASTLLAGAAVWTGVLEGPSGVLAGIACSLCAGAFAAAVFPASKAQEHVLAVIEGAAPGPLILDRSA